MLGAQLLVTVWLAAADPVPPQLTGASIGGSAVVVMEGAIEA